MCSIACIPLPPFQIVRQAFLNTLLLLVKCMKAHIAHVALSIYSHLHYWSYYLLKFVSPSPRRLVLWVCVGRFAASLGVYVLWLL
jgi:hypothetical protein